MVLSVGITQSCWYYFGWKFPPFRYPTWLGLTLKIVVWVAVVLFVYHLNIFYDDLPAYLIMCMPISKSDSWHMMLGVLGSFYLQKLLVTGQI